MGKYKTEKYFSEIVKIKTVIEILVIITMFLVKEIVILYCYIIYT